jgi:acyl carrier protein
MGSAVEHQDSDIMRFIAYLLDLDIQEVTATMRLSDLVADSFMLVQLSIEVQEQFNIIFYADDLGRIDYVGDLVDLVRERM